MAQKWEHSPPSNVTRVWILALTPHSMWVEFVVGSLHCSEGLFSGYSGFPLSLKTSTSNFLQCCLQQVMRPRYWVQPFTLSDPYLVAILRISAILAMALLRRQACHQAFPRCHLTIPRTTTDPSVRLSSTGPKVGNCHGQRQLRPELVSGMVRSVTTRKASIPITIIRCLQGGNKISHEWKVFKP